jgi:hypothetical protein
MGATGRAGQAATASAPQGVRRDDARHCGPVSLRRPEMNARRLLHCAGLAAGLVLLAAFTLGAQAQPVQRVRGTVQSFDGSTLVVTDRGGQTVRLSYPENASVSEVVPIDRAALKQGAYIGTAALKDADGSLRALEVVVFPEAARGTAEGHGPWDLQPGSTMTNATIAQVVTTSNGDRLELRYKDGEQAVVVPQGVPIVTFRPADRTLLVPGAKVVIFAREGPNGLSAARILAGRDGFQPPM